MTFAEWKLTQRPGFLHSSKGIQKSKYENKEVGNPKIKNILKESPKLFSTEKTYSRKSAFQ